MAYICILVYEQCLHLDTILSRNHTINRKKNNQKESKIVYNNDHYVIYTISNIYNSLW